MMRLSTKLKDKVSGDWRYPLGATRIGEALGDFPEPTQLGLWFWGHKPRLRKHSNPPSVLMVAQVFWEKQERARSTACSGRDKDPEEPCLKLEIQAVPKEHHARIKELLVSEGLGLMRTWLLEKRTPLQQEMGCGLRLSYHLLEDQLLVLRWG